MSYSLLLVEDDKRMQEIIEDYFLAQGSNVTSVDNGVSALEQIKLNSYDLVLLDIMIPKLDGFSVCKRIREDRETPIIFLTAKNDEYDKLYGYEVGADDYVTKPFGIMELLSRIRSVLRRSGKPTDKKGELLSFGTIRADRNRHVVTVDEKEVAVTLKEFQLLCYLLLNKGIVLSREQIMQAVWDIPFEMESRTIDMHIMSLRQKLGGEGAAIRTIRGVGYRLGEREK